MDNAAAIKAPLLEMKQIVKYFPGTIAVDKVDLVCHRGEIHALVGENGAGKSTLMKVLAGIYPPDGGAVAINGIGQRFKNYSDARRKGIGVVYQELSLLTELSVAENIYMGIWPRKKTGLIDWKGVRQKSSAILNDIGVDIDPDELVASLPMALRQMVEIAKILIQDPDILVFDEPTAALSKDEVGILFNILKDLKLKDKALIFISHRLDEVLSISDVITVMKDGQKVTTAVAAVFNEDKLVSAMVGRQVTEIFPQKRERHDKQIKLFSFEGHLKKFQEHIAFSLFKGEVLGFGGLQGQGQIELLEAVFGLGHCADVTVKISDQPVSIHNPVQAMRSGIALIPENRSEEGVFLILSAQENLAAPSMNQRQSFGFIQKQKEKQSVSEIAERLSIKITSLKQIANSLSGGNLQKLVLGKWLLSDPQVIVMLEPTKGVDVATKQQIYKLIRALAHNDVGVILYTSDMLELIGVCDRVLVMNQGGVTAELEGDDITEENIMKASVSPTNLLGAGASQ